jgi:putative transcriptional regulator
MSNAFSIIKQGLEEALDFSKGRDGKAVIHKFSALDVKEVPAKVGMSYTNQF